MKTLNAWCLSGNPITTFTFPSGVTTVPGSMFYGCENLITVYFTNKITKILYRAFYNCVLLKNVELPSNLTELGSEAFYNCISLKSISLPESLETLGDGVFLLTRGLTISLQNPNLVIDDFTMYRDNNQTLFTYLGSNQNYNITVKSSCTLIAPKTFLQKKLQNVYFSNNENMTIGAYAFDSSLIKSIVMPPGLNTIESYAFQNCKILENVTFLGNQLKSIPEYCFYKNSNLKYIKLPTSIESIGNYAFQECPLLGDIGISSLNLLTSIGISAFKSSGLTTANLSPSVRTIGSSAFSGSSITGLTISCDIPQYMCQFCTSLTTLEMQAGIVEINIYAFSGCTSLIGFTIPTNLQTIGSFSFQNCEVLENVNMATNGNLNSVAGGSFQGCYKLKEIHLSPMEEKFSFYNGALMNFNQTQLIVFIPYSDIKNFVVPSEMEVIGSNAFMGSPKLMRVFFSGNRINRINYQAFKDCSNLNLVFFASSKIEVTFGTEVFLGCNNLKKCGSFSVPPSVKTTLLEQGIPSIAFKDDCETSVTCKIRPDFKISSAYLFPFITMNV